jgi:predicted regulator of Ras-like GTPase activity (Roadblock/LC7/MglB family)
MTVDYGLPLETLTRLRGVRGAMVVSAEDGIVVADALMEDVSGEAVAALAASLAQRMGQAVTATGYAVPTFLHLQTSAGALLIVPTGEDLLLIVFGSPDINVGLTRVEMLNVSEQLH